MIISFWLEFYLRDIQVNVYVLSLYVCVFTFSTSMFFFPFTCNILLPFRIWCLSVDFVAIFFQFNKLLVKPMKTWTLNIIVDAVRLVYNCCCVNKNESQLKRKIKSKPNRIQSMASIIVSLFISLWNRKKIVTGSNHQNSLDLLSTINN